MENVAPRDPVYTHLWGDCSLQPYPTSSKLHHEDTAQHDADVQEPLLRLQVETYNYEILITRHLKQAL